MLVVGCLATLAGRAYAQGPLSNPILYVTQVPVTETSNTVVSIGGSHLGDTRSAPRGGDLMIRYPDGNMKNLTRAAGFGQSGQQQATSRAIAVRDPAVHWSGTRALFSMVIGAPLSANDPTEFFWQIYEISGLGWNQTPMIERVAGQSADFNNVQPTYSSSDNTIIFVSDSTRDKSRTLYPAIDEKGSGQAVTGLWKLDRASRKTSLLEHSPSGSFKPSVDSFGRIVFSRWDHLQRDEVATRSPAFDFVSEALGSGTEQWSDVFPEPLTDSAYIFGHKFDLFFPWTINQDGTMLRTINHAGRHELGTGAKRSTRDSNLVDSVPAANPFGFFNFNPPTRGSSYLQLSEHPNQPGKYIATDAVSTAVSAGRLLVLNAPPTTNADAVTVTLANNTGFARDAGYLQDGRLFGSFASGPVITTSYGSATPGEIAPTEIPASNNPFRITVSQTFINLATGTQPIPSAPVTVTNIISGSSHTFSGKLWQLQPVEVTSREVPPSTSTPLPPQEIQMFREAGVSIAKFKAWLKSNGQAIMIMRNLTARDANDRQQPYNLYVPGGASSIVDGGPSHAITHLQVFEGDQVRGYLDASGQPDTEKGRRVTARVLHDDISANIPNEIPGSAEIAADGSAAFIVPSTRALTWQTTNGAGEPVVRERYWLSFSAGEIRSCTACHATNTTDQVGRTELTNPPLALKTLLTSWAGRFPEANASVSPFGFWAEMNIAPDAHSDGDADGDGLSNIEEYVYGGDPNSRPSESTTAIPLGLDVISRAGEEHVQLSFTRRLDAGVRIAIESSTDLSHWTEEAVIDRSDILPGQAVEIDTASTTPEQAAAGLQLVEVVSKSATRSDHRRHYRLKFQE